MSLGSAEIGFNQGHLPGSPIKLAFLTTDAREHWREYHKTEPYFGTAPAGLLDGFALLPEQVDVHVISCIQRPMASPAKLASNIWFHTLLVSKIGWMRTGFQGCIRAVRRFLPGLRPDIVHGQGTERDCAISSVFSGFPNVITVHGNMRLISKINRSRPFTYQWLAARLERLTLPRSHGVVCITRYTEHAVRSLARRTWVVPNAVDKSFFDVQHLPVIPATILCVGHISPRKNQVQFIRSLDPIAAKRKIRVLFLGGAPKDDPYCNEFFKVIQNRPWCSYEGTADRSRLKTEFSQARLLALPSLEDNCPMVVLEAMAAGVPVAAAEVGGVPELVEDGATGILFDPEEPSSVQAGIIKALDNEANSRTMAEAARRRALQLYHPKVIAGMHLDIYREALNTES